MNVIGLYKKDSKNKLRVLKISTNGSFLIQESGLFGGKLVYHEKECKGKNIGKSNETSSEKQAELEAESLIIKKIKEGYSKTINTVKSNFTILPMLAKEYNKEKYKIDWNTCYIQPKLDGMRCLDNKGNKISRTNTIINTVNHIIVNRPKNIEFIVDGELYAHGLDFQDNMKIIKKITPNTINVKYHVYDLICDLPFIDRYNLLIEIVNLSENLELVPTFKINSEEELKQYHSKFLSDGYEGSIIRWGNEKYEINKRSSHLLKYKDFKDMTSEIIDIIPMEVYPKQGLVVCKGFIATPKMSHKEREDLLINKDSYIGKIAEIRYFEETKDGKPRFPIYVGLRLDK